MTQPHNQIFVIAPYRYNGTWVFDDPIVGLIREPFVAGVPEMIDELVAEIPGAENGFRLTFSAKEFPGYQIKALWKREECGGNWYAIGDKEGWLCPALFEYFDTAPAELYINTERIYPC